MLGSAPKLGATAEVKPPEDCCDVGAGPPKDGGGAPHPIVVIAGGQREGGDVWQPPVFGV